MKRRVDKRIRQDKIREIITARAIETQQLLTEALLEMDIEVTQATVSRDIKEMRLIKVTADGGRSRYACPNEEAALPAKNRLEQLLAEAIIRIDNSENIIVLKTLPGTANAICAALDNAAWPEIIGTLAGDDTILVVVKPKEAVASCRQKIAAMWGGN
ncbi:MAG: arginine repressor [Selenomonadaceae bacterium]|nr:arginine repressor [Selenomonadaceae bacterium]